MGVCVLLLLFAIIDQPSSLNQLCEATHDASALQPLSSSARSRDWSLDHSPKPKGILSIPNTFLAHPTPHGMHRIFCCSIEDLFSCACGWAHACAGHSLFGDGDRSVVADKFIVFCIFCISVAVSIDHLGKALPIVTMIGARN